MNSNNPLSMVLLASLALALVLTGPDTMSGRTSLLAHHVMCGLVRPVFVRPEQF